MCDQRLLGLGLLQPCPGACLHAGKQSHREVRPSQAQSAAQDRDNPGWRGATEGTGHLLPPGEGGDGGGCQSEANLFAAPKITAPQFGRPPVTLPRTKIDKIRPCFTLSHGDASWDEAGERRGASPTPGTGLCPHTQSMTTPVPAACDLRLSRACRFKTLSAGYPNPCAYPTRDPLHPTAQAEQRGQRGLSASAPSSPLTPRHGQAQPCLCQHGKG